jgi:serine/threonine protein kinase
MKSKMLPAEEIKLAVNSLSEDDESRQEFTTKLEQIFNQHPEQATELLEIAQQEITKTNLPKLVRTEIHNLAEHSKILSIENATDPKALPQNTNSSEWLTELLKSNEKSQVELNPGMKIGNYRLEKLLGTGGMGEVWKAIHLIHDVAETTGTERFVAIKFLNFDFRTHPDAFKVFAREFSRTRNLIHENIVHVFELNESDNRIFIVMEFLSGSPLKNWIQEHPNGIPLEKAKPIILGICNSLIYAHQNDIIHLDINPNNIFYDPNLGIVKTIDFGISRHANPIERDKTRYDVGKLNAVTEAYASLEMLHSIDPDPRDDIYGLACVTYELLTGHHPYEKYRADIVISEEKKPVEIKSLNSLQNKTLLGALNPLRKQRVPNVEQFRNGILPDLVTPPKLKNIPILSLLVVITISALWLIPKLIGKLSDFEFDPIRQEILVENPDAAVTLFQSPKEDQFKILANKEVINGLINIYTKKNEDDPIQELQALDLSLQKRIFEDTDVKDRLIIHYKRSIDENINKDKYPIAQNLLSSINKIYPYDKRIGETKQLLQIGKNQRINELTNQFKSCISNHSKHSIKPADCLVSAWNKILTVDPTDQPSLDKIDKWFEKSIRESLSNTNGDLSNNLLKKWEIIQKDDPPSRVFLKKAIAIGNAPISNLPQLWKEFAKNDSEVKSNILDFKLAQNKLLEYIIGNALLNARENNYQDAFTLFEDTITVINNHKDSSSRLKKALKKLKQEHQGEIDLLNSNYQTKQNNCDPAQLKILDLIHEIGGKPIIEKNIDKNCISSIRKLLIGGNLTGVNHQFDNWKELNPKIPLEFKTLMIAKKILFTGKNKVHSNIKTLVDLPASQQNIALDITPVRMQVENYFKEKVEEKINTSGFPSTLEFIDKIIEKISIHPKTSTSLHQLRDIVQKRQKRKIVSLLFEYQKEAQKCSKAISTIQLQLDETGSDRPPYQGVDEKCFKKIKALLVNEEIAKAENILNNWQHIRPDNETIYLEQRNQISKKMANAKVQLIHIQTLSEKLKQSIDKKDDNSVIKITNQANGFSLKYTERFLNENEIELTNYFIAKGKEALSNEDYNNAQEYCERGLKIFSKSTKLKTDCIDLVNNQRQQQISGLTEKFKEYLDKGWLVIGIRYPNGILGILDQIENYDKNNSLLTSLEVHTAFKIALLDTIKKMRLQEARNIHAGWVKFFERKYITEDASKIRDSAYNLAASNALLISRNLIHEGSKETAKRFLKFGLDLQPISTVKEQIENELTNLTSSTVNN